MGNSKSIQIPTTIKNDELVKKRREQIIRAAIKLFEQKGFHKTTMRDLAKETGITHGNIYDYVGSKEDIFFLIHVFISGIADNFVATSTQGIVDPLERLLRIIKSEFKLLYDWEDAILVIYQQGHILSKKFLKKLLTKERSRVAMLEEAIKECIIKGYIRDVNVRAAANLIRIMIDSWVLKRWDLRGHISRPNMEKMIIDFFIQGLLQDKSPMLKFRDAVKPLVGKSALIINGKTVLGKEISAMLERRGARVAVYSRSIKETAPTSKQELMKSTIDNLYCYEDYGDMNIDTLQHIINDFGPIDFVIHDLSLNIDSGIKKQKTDTKHEEDLASNFDCAQNLANHLIKELSQRESGRIIYLAPWAWDMSADPLRYDVIKAGTIGLTKKMAMELAMAKVNVNCIIPGLIKDDWPSKAHSDYLSTMLDKIPMGHLGEIPDVLEALFFLITDASKYLTGQILEVTGGA